MKGCQEACGSGCYAIIANVILTSAGLANESVEYVLYLVVSPASTRRLAS